MDNVPDKKLKKTNQKRETIKDYFGLEISWNNKRKGDINEKETKRRKSDKREERQIRYGLRGN